MAGSCGWVSVSAETVSGLKAILGGLSLGRGIPFPDADRFWMKRTPQMAETMQEQAAALGMSHLL